MLRMTLLALLSLPMGGCTTVTLNDGSTNTVTHKEGPGVAEEMATRACRKAGEGQAVILSTVNKDPSQLEGTGRQVTTFRCTSAQTPPRGMDR
jgi:hypothetical protein